MVYLCSVRYRREIIRRWKSFHRERESFSRHKSRSRPSRRRRQTVSGKGMGFTLHFTSNTEVREGKNLLADSDPSESYLPSKGQPEMITSRDTNRLKGNIAFWVGMWDFDRSDWFCNGKTLMCFFNPIVLHGVGMLFFQETLRTLSWG